MTFCREQQRRETEAGQALRGLGLSRKKKTREAEAMGGLSRLWLGRQQQQRDMLVEATHGIGKVGLGRQQQRRNMVAEATHTIAKLGLGQQQERAMEAGLPPGDETSVVWRPRCSARWKTACSRPLGGMRAGTVMAPNTAKGEVCGGQVTRRLR